MTITAGGSAVAHSAAPTLPTKPVSAPDFDALRERIEKRATTSQRSLLRAYDADPAGTWSRIQSWNLEDEDQLVAVRTVASEMARRAVFNFDLLIRGLKEFGGMRVLDVN